MKKTAKKVLLVLLSLCIIMSLTACEPKEYTEEWYAQQIYIDRIYVEHTDNLEDGLKIKMVITENGDKTIGDGIVIEGNFYDIDGNVIEPKLLEEAEIRDSNPFVLLSLSEQDLPKLHSQTISCEWEDGFINEYEEDFSSIYNFSYNFRYTDTLSDIATFRITKIVIIYELDDSGNIADYLEITGEQLNYVISPDAYNDDYDEYTNGMEKIQAIAYS